jgi:hypothetical protein
MVVGVVVGMEMSDVMDAVLGWVGRGANRKWIRAGRDRLERLDCIIVHNAQRDASEGENAAVGCSLQTVFKGVLRTTLYPNPTFTTHQIPTSLPT